MLKCNRIYNLPLALIIPFSVAVLAFLKTNLPSDIDYVSHIFIGPQVFAMFVVNGFLIN